MTTSPGVRPLARREYWESVPGPPSVVLHAVRPVAAALVRSAWRLRVLGREHVPAAGPVILASNHTAVLDGPVLSTAAPRPVHTLIKKEMFQGPAGVVLRGIGQIRVDRQAVDPAAVKRALAALHRGDVVGLFPEGTRCAGEFGAIKPGVAYFALCTGAPVVPVACLGTRDPSRSVGSVPRLRSVVHVVFGPPVRLQPVPWPRRRDAVRGAADQLRVVLAKHVRAARARTGEWSR